MQYALWVFISFVAYAAGVVILLRVTPMLLHRQYDEGLFMGIAAMDILGALLAFGGIIIPLALFTGVLAIVFRVLGVILLLGIILVAARLARRSFQPRVSAGTFRISRIIAGSYSIFIALASLYYIVQIFIIGH